MSTENDLSHFWVKSYGLSAKKYKTIFATDIIQKHGIRKLFDKIENDIIEPFFVEEKIDQIYNLACPASPVHYQENPVRTIKANTIGMINVLGMARKHGARLMQASTSEV